MLVAGDEFGRSQQGNNNAWCQDNAVSWLDWTLAEKNQGQLRFFRKLIHLRTTHPIFRRDTFFLCGNLGPEDVACSLEILWQNLQPGSQDWSHDCRTLAFMLNGTMLAQEDDDFFVMLNGSPTEAALFTVPSPNRNRLWKRIIDTGRRSPHDFVDPKRADAVECGQTVSMSAMGCIVLQSQPTR
jgi:glycogen operon protein